MSETFCPICDNITLNYNRYFKIVCFDCVSSNTLYNGLGNKIVFGIEDNKLSAIITDKEGNKTQTNANICYLKGYKCIAEAGYYGGVILQCIENTNKKRKINFN